MKMFSPRMRFFSLAAAVCSLFGAALWLVFFSRVLIIEYIDVASDNLDKTFVRSLVYQYMDERNGIFNQHNLLFFKKNAFLRYFSQYALIENFILTKQYPKTIRITVSGSPFRVIGYSEGRFYEVSPAGTLLSEFDGSSLTHYPTAIRETLVGKRVVVSKDVLKKMDLTVPIIIFPPVGSNQSSSPVLEPSTIQHIETVKKSLANEKFTLLFFRPDATGYEFKAYTNEGWYIIGTTQSDSKQQADNVKTVLSSFSKQKRKNLEYIDARFQNRLFYKVLD